MRLPGIDVSSYQGEIDFAKVAAHGIKFVYAKASEGEYFADPTFGANHDGCKANDIAFGAYHFFRPGVDPSAQANHFAAVIDGRAGALTPMIDIEVDDGVFDIVPVLARFLEVLDPLIKPHQPILYSSLGFWNGQMRGTNAFSGHRLWMAQYNSDPNPTLPSGFRTWTVWQHSSEGQVPGISGHVDLDVLADDKDLSALV